MGFLNITEQKTEGERKTKIFQVYSNVFLGLIHFRSQWRKFVFEPTTNVVFDSSCLNEIANFCTSETNKWREGLKERKEDAKI